MDIFYLQKIEQKEIKDKDSFFFLDIIAKSFAKCSSNLHFNQQILGTSQWDSEMISSHIDKYKHPPKKL